LSRCQRFDLRRIPADVLAEHFRKVAEAEQVSVEPEALALIARAAEGSARDGLSILDQAIAHGEAGVTADQVRAMLGLSDRGAIRRLLGLLLAGDAHGALAALNEQYDLGVEPSAAVRGLLEAVHGITRFKVGGGDDPALSAEEREAYGDWATELSFASVHRLWQLLLKGLAEVHAAPSPLEAAEMALLRVIHAAELPDPGELAAKLVSGDVMTSPEVSAPSAKSPVERAEQAPAPPADFPGFVKLLEARGAALLAHRLADDMRLVDYAPPILRLQAARALDAKRIDDLLGELRAFTKKAFGQPWQIGMAEGSAQPSLREQELARERDAEQRVRDMPVVKAAFEAFPDAELAGWTLDDQRSA
jgi:DNA polymerase-3 subunit gamma/tau